MLRRLNSMLLTKKLRSVCLSYTPPPHSDRSNNFCQKSQGDNELCLRYFTFSSAFPITASIAFHHSRWLNIETYVVIMPLVSSCSLTTGSSVLCWRLRQDQTRILSRCKLQRSHRFTTSRIIFQIQLNYY